MVIADAAYDSDAILDHSREPKAKAPASADSMRKAKDAIWPEVCKRFDQTKRLFGRIKCFRWAKTRYA